MNFKKIVVIGLILTISGLAFSYFTSTGAFYRPFEDFKGPGYVPVGFNNSENHTTDNERIFEYRGNGTFYVGVVKNTNNSKLENFLLPFKEDPETTKHTNETITINGHVVEFQSSFNEFKLDKSDLKVLTKFLPSNQSMPKLDKIPDLNLNMVKFQATWKCEETGLTYVVMGMTIQDQINEIKKMTNTIQCHKENKSIWETIFSKNNIV